MKYRPRVTLSLVFALLCMVLWNRRPSPEPPAPEEAPASSDTAAPERVLARVTEPGNQAPSTSVASEVPSASSALKEDRGVEAPVNPASAAVEGPLSGDRPEAGGSGSMAASASAAARVTVSGAGDWRNQVGDPERLVLPEILRREGQRAGLERLDDADLSEMEVRGRYLVKIFDTFDRPGDKHGRRRRNRLSELLEEAVGGQTRARAEVMGLEYEGIDEQGRGFLIVGFDRGEPQYIHTLNASAADSSAASYVRQNTDFDPVFGPDIDGSGFFFNVNDHGVARQHLEFQLPNGGGSRVIEREVPDNDSHMDHVTGTVGAHGYREDAKGMAPAVMMYSLNQQSDSDVSLLGAQYPFQPRRSIGGTTSLGGGYDAMYSSGGRTFDQVLRETPYYLHFYAAGNDGDWNSISSGDQIAKNVITVGSGKHVNRDASGNYLSGGSLSGFSSEGPADDGRIKPDILANGEGVTSTVGTSGYSSKQGTSMATPNASGSSILLQDYFSKRFPGHLMQSVALKNLILHTADDIGNTGPDYRHGWGFMNTRKAADIIKAYADNPGNRRMTEGVLRNGDTHTYTFTWDGVSPLIANLAWLDYKGPFINVDDDRTPVLTYDLDLRVVSPSGATTHLPWAMPFVLNGFDTNDYNTPAVKADNTTDNIEQVKINSPAEAGVYTVTVSHKGSISVYDEVRYSLIVSGVDNASTAPAPTISSFTPAEGTHDHTLVTVTGSGFLLGANVSLQAPGLQTVEGYAEKVTPEEIEVFLPLDRVAAGDYKLVVLNPDGQSVSSPGDFTVTAYTDVLSEDFDDAGIPAGWTTGAVTGTNDWTISTTVAVGGNSVHVPTRTEEVESYLESPPIAVPNTNDPIKLSFEHQWDFEIELAATSFAAHDGEDGAILRVSVDGGPFKDVDQDYWDNGQAPGTEIVSGDYWDNIDSTSPIRYPSATTYAWTDASGGWQRTTVILDPTTYKNKTLRFRWVLGTQNTGSDNDEGWWIDNVSLSVKADNVPPQVSTVPATEATEGQPYNETLAFTDADNDALSLIATSKPAWLSVTDNGNRTATLSGTPSSGDVGTHEVTIEADDGTGVRVYTFSLIVLPAGGNNPPAFTTTALDPAITEQAYSFDLVTTDVDGHTLTLQVEGLPAWLSFMDNGDGTGTLSGTPNTYAPGTIDLTAEVSDGITTIPQVFALQILPPAEIAFTTGSVSVGEGDGSVTLTVTRAFNSLGEVSVDYTTVSGTATADDDYTTASGTLAWADGDSDPKTIHVPIVDDSVYNETESFSVVLSNPTNDAVLGATTQVTVAIAENDLNDAPVLVLDNPAHSLVTIPSGVGLILETTVTDDGVLQPVVLTWSQVSGPGTVNWDNTDQADTAVTFSADGVYVLRLSADDGLAVSTLDVTVDVGGTPGNGLTSNGPTDSLIGWWQMNEGGGTTAADSSGNGNDGAITEAAWSTENLGTALVFDGTNDRVSLGDVDAVDGATALSLSFWVRIDDVNKDHALITKSAFAGSSDMFVLWRDDAAYNSGRSNTLTWGLGNGSTDVRLEGSENALNDTGWHHIVLTFEAGSATGMRLYIDGVEDAQSPVSTTSFTALPSSATDLRFGIDASNSSGKWLDGAMDEVRIYSRVLTPAEVTALGQAASGNLAPVVDAGSTPGGTALSAIALDAMVTDDGQPAPPGAVTTVWTKVGGPGTVVFGDSTAVDTTATCDIPGEYTLQLTAGDGGVSTFDRVTFTVAPSGPSVIIIGSGGNTAVTEGGATDSYGLVLGQQPASDVTVTVSPDAQVSVDPVSLVFTDANWNTPQTVTVTAVDDAVNEGNHSGGISHSASSADGDYNGIGIDAVSVSITDNDLPGTLALTASSASVGEGDGSVLLTVSRTGGSAGAASVNYATGNGSATAGSDFTASTGTLNWADGDSADKQIVIDITDDADGEGSETFSVTLSGASGAGLGSPAEATVTITDNEETSYLINFGLANYTTDGTRVWQTFNPTDASAVNATANPVAVPETLLADTGGSTLAGVTFRTDISGSGSSTMAINGNVTEAMLQGDPYDWFDGTVAAQREVPALQNGNSQVFTLDGFAVTDIVDVEFVFKRDNSGDRAVTVTYQSAGDVMNDLQVDDDADGGPQYPSISGLQGSGSYSFTIASTGTGWGCLPNAIRVRVRPGGDFTPEMVQGLVGWYDAQALGGADGTAVTTWTDTTGGSNTAANDLVQVAGDRYLTGTQTDLAPTLRTVSLNGFDFQAVRFVPGASGQYELLKAADLVTAGDSDRTLVAVVKGGLSTESRVIGFGSSLDEDINGSALVWNLGCDDNGTSRFDGAMIGAYTAGLDRTQVVIRTAVMESKTSFDEYIDVLDGSFADNQVLSNGNPSNALGNTRGHFYLGDVQQNSLGGGSMAAEFDVLEVLVFDTALSDAQRVAVQDWLKTKYTTDPNPPATPAAPSGLTATAVSSTGIDLTWSDNSDNEDGFRVQRAETSGGPWSDVTTTAADATSYSDTGRDPGTEYFYQVIASNGLGDSAPTSEASATTWILQQQYFADSGLAHDVDPDVDSDGDGLNNGDEYTAGTNPNSGASVFQVGASASGGGMSLQTPTVSGKTYRVYWRASLTELPDWAQVGTAWVSDGSDLNMPVTQPGFYRITVE